MCVNGASWVRENVLEAYVDDEITVYAVWFNMIPGDRKSRWNPNLLADERVTHYWDEDRVLGKWIAKNVDDCEHLGPIDWDSYYLFDEDGHWDKSFEDLKACGTPIFRNTENLATALEEVMNDDEE